eukprot:1693907-Alexandrium_andersonii.AAC.1
MLSEEFDPTKESRESWQARVLRVSTQLERAGRPLTEAEMEKLVRKGKYCETLKGKNQKEQVDWLKSEFGRVLLADGLAEAEYNGRLE